MYGEKDEKKINSNKKIKSTRINSNTITVVSVKGGRVCYRGRGGQQMSELYVQYENKLVREN